MLLQAKRTTEENPFVIHRNVGLITGGLGQQSRPLDPATFAESDLR